MSGQRVYVAVNDAESWERFILQKSVFLLAGRSKNGTEALKEIKVLAPDILILDGALAGMDGFSLLDVLRKQMIAPPRILFLSRIREEKWLRLALEKGADGVIYWPDTETKGISALQEVADKKIPALARATERMRADIAENMLLRLQVSPTLKGRDYIRFAIACCACAPHLSQSYSRKLYPLIAAHFSATPQAVERAIRTAIENTWLQGNLNEIQNLFGFSVDADRGKPTNAEFLSMLSEHARREGQKNLEKQTASMMLK